ncbi:hypothetical protein STEG23_019284 [Scotinomys teguina]
MRVKANIQWKPKETYFELDSGVNMVSSGSKDPGQDFRVLTVASLLEGLSFIVFPTQSNLNSPLNYLKKFMLWDVFLYAMNMRCSDWLMNKAALAYGKAA